MTHARFLTVVAASIEASSAAAITTASSRTATRWPAVLSGTPTTGLPVSSRIAISPTSPRGCATLTTPGGDSTATRPISGRSRRISRAASGGAERFRRRSATAIAITSGTRSTAIPLFRCEQRSALARLARRAIGSSSVQGIRTRTSTAACQSSDSSWQNYSAAPCSLKRTCTIGTAIGWTIVPRTLSCGLRASRAGSGLPILLLGRAMFWSATETM